MHRRRDRTSAERRRRARSRVEAPGQRHLPAPRSPPRAALSPRARALRRKAQHPNSSRPRPVAHHSRYRPGGGADRRRAVADALPKDSGGVLIIGVGVVASNQFHRLLGQPAWRPSRHWSKSSASGHVPRRASSPMCSAATRCAERTNSGITGSHDYAESTRLRNRGKGQAGAGAGGVLDRRHCDRRVGDRTRTNAVVTRSHDLALQIGPNRPAALPRMFATSRRWAVS